MSEFKAITTQEELNAIIGERLARAEESYSKKYADYEQLKTRVGNLETENAKLSESLTEAGNKVSGFEKTIAEKDLQIKGYESHSVKQRIAHEIGLPFEIAERLNGNTEEEIKKDAETLYKVIGTSKPVAPLASSESKKADEKTQAYKNMLSDLFKK